MTVGSPCRRSGPTPGSGRQRARAVLAAAGVLPLRLPGLLILGLWEILGPLVNPILFSYPSKIAVAFYELTFERRTALLCRESLQILFYGLGFAILVGVPLAVLMARFKPIDWALDLPINALYATPLVAVVPLLVLWFGIYLKAKIIVVFLFAVFPVLINTYQGVRECDKNMLEVARSFRSSGGCGRTCCCRSRCPISSPASGSPSAAG